MKRLKELPVKQLGTDADARILASINAARTRKKSRARWMIYPAVAACCAIALLGWTLLAGDPTNANRTRMARVNPRASAIVVRLDESFLSEPQQRPDRIDISTWRILDASPTPPMPEETP
ncbi:MAG: hypothetical protein H6817_10710 [Phycisphaerales bacterium]|nr:hypothetical protein [Phycisphaerales bacterium]